MNYRAVRAVLLITISLVSAGILVVDSPLTSIIPKANAAIPGSKGVVGFFDEASAFRSSAVVSPSLAIGSFVRFDINATGFGAIKGIIIEFNWTSTALTYSNSSYGNYVNVAQHYHANTFCPASQGCLFDGFPSGKIVENQNSTSPGGYFLSLTDICTTSCNPTVPGTGILFRIAFKVAAASQHTVIHFATTITQIQNPTALPYENIDGYFDNNATPLLNYGLSLGVAQTNVRRPVSQFQTNATAAVGVTVSSLTGTGPIAFSAVGLPNYSTATFSPTSCSASCTPTLTVTVHGGQAGQPGTTPSGNYTVAIIANATSPSPAVGMVRESWISLYVRPPKPPVITLSTTGNPRFRLEAGTFKTFSVTANLASGANDSLTEADTCLNVQVLCSVTPPGGVFLPILTPTSFSSTLNATSTATVPTGVYRFNLTATTSGTYSEQSVSANLTFTVTITRTHDLLASGESMPKLFSYEGVSLVRPSGHPINMTAIFTNQGRVPETFSVNATAKASLVNESPSNITFLDSNSNGVWDSGILSTDPRIKFIDTNGNGVWDPLVLQSDPLIKFVDANSNGHWDPGETVVYDTNNNGLYDSGEPVISGTTPAASTPLTVDAKLRFVDVNTNGHWDAGEPVIYDSNGNGVWDSGFENVIAGKPVVPEPIIYDNIGNGLFGAADTVILGNRTLISNLATLKNDPKLKFEDLNGDGVWEQGESVAYDTNGDGNYQAGEVAAVGPTPLREAVIHQTNYDPRIRFVDSNFDFAWTCTTPTPPTCAAGESVVYDSNGNGVYDTGEPVIFGSTPTAGTSLSNDAKIRFVDSNNNGVWNTGEPVVYDANNNGLYDTSEIVISGATPTAGTALKGSQAGKYSPGDVVISGVAPPLGTNINYDPNLKFVDSNFNGKWDSGETVIDDSNGDGVYEHSDPVIFGTPPSTGILLGTGTVTNLSPADPLVSGTAANGASLKMDSKIKYVDLNGTAYFGGQESVVYDSNGNGLYDAADPHIKFYDSNFTGVWQCAVHTATACTTGKPIFYDANNNGKYDVGETIIFGVCSAPCAIGATLKTDPNIRYVDSNNNGVWNTGEPLVYDSNNNGIYDASDLIITGTPTIGQFLKGEPVIAGPVPRSGAILSSDLLLKYVDLNSNNVWDNNEAVIYDLPNSGVYFNGATTAVINVDPENAPHGNFIIYAYAVPNAGEISLANNGIGVVSFVQRLRGDANGDCKVNIFDLTTVAGIFGATAGSSSYNIAADLNNDGVINIFDLSLVGGNFGATC